VLSVHGREAEERSEALLVSHLTSAQEREYRASRTFTVVKEGVVWRTVLGYCAIPVVLTVLAVVGATVPRLEAATIAAGIGFVFVIASFLLWIPPLMVACTRRRIWILGLGRKPALVFGSRRIAFCVRVEADVPEADRVLAFKNVLEGNERYFLRKANALV
jgi:hypothetical protein